MAFSQDEYEEFKAEALELLDTAEKSLLELGEGGEFGPLFDAIFRSFHNLKGASGMMELQELQSHTHELENILMKYKGAGEIPKEIVGFFLQGIDGARALLDGKQIDKTMAQAAPLVDASSTMQQDLMAEPTMLATAPFSRKIEGVGTLDEFVTESGELIERVSRDLQALEENPSSRDLIDSLYRDVHSLKGSAYLFSFNTLGDLGHAVESALDGVRAGTLLTVRQLFDVLFKCVTIMERTLAEIRLKASDEAYAGLVAKAIQTLNEVVSRLPRMDARDSGEKEKGSEPVSSPQSCTESDEGGSDKAASQDMKEATQEMAIKPSNTSPSTSAVSPKERETEGATSIRVPIALLDNLMTLMGEMVLVRNQVLQYSSRVDDAEFSNMSKRLNVVTGEIQGEMMKTRMQPIGNVLSKFNRVVRDLSNDLGKTIHLNLSGSETELDKSLLESVKDPLTHIVRNSCDHGIELPDIRVKAAKPVAGTIDIKAYHEGGQVVIEIADDGKGLDREILIRKAIEKGILPQAKAQTLSDKEAFNLIFAPGFSTAAKVSNVSGRGVGMDVVRTNIERIGGTVDLSSTLGLGTTIKIKIPLTLAIVPALILKNRGETFAIPQVRLEEILRIDGANGEHGIETLHGTPVYRLRGRILPLVDLSHLLKMGGENSDYKNRVTNIAVLTAEHCSFGLIVDEVHDTADIVVKPLNRLLKSLQVYSGATILGNGSVALILDVVGLSKVADVKYDRVRNIAEDQESFKKEVEAQDFLLFNLNSPTKHCFPLGYVNRLEEFKRAEIEVSGHQRVVRYRNMILPILSANEALGYGAGERASETVSIIVVLRGDQFYGIEVDSIIDTLSTTADAEPAVIRQPGIFGNLSTKDELIVITDPFEMIASAFPDAVQHSSKIRLDDAAGVSEPRRILLVEDTIFFRRSITSVLEKAGHSVAVAGDGQEALDVLNENQQEFDLVISDIEMPRMNGFELARSIRKHPSHGKIPLLAVSSRADRNHTDEGAKAGFNLYLEKLKTEDLLGAVRILTRKEKVA